MSELTSLTLAEARDAIRAKKISSKELTGAFVKAIEGARPLNAFITEAGEKALLAAESVKALDRDQLSVRAAHARTGFAAAKLLSGRSLFEGSHGAGYLLRAVLLLDGYIPNDPNFYNQAAWSISVELAAYLAAALLFGRRRYGIAAAVAIWLVSLAGYVAGIDAPVFGEMLQRCLVGFGLGVLCLGLYRRLALPQAIRLWSAVEAMVLVLAAALMALLAVVGENVFQHAYQFWTFDLYAELFADLSCNCIAAVLAKFHASAKRPRKMITLN